MAMTGLKKIDDLAPKNSPTKMVIFVERVHPTNHAIWITCWESWYLSLFPIHSWETKGWDNWTCSSWYIMISPVFLKWKKKTHSITNLIGFIEQPSIGKSDWVGNQTIYHVILYEVVSHLWEHHVIWSPKSPWCFWSNVNMCVCVCVWTVHHVLAWILHKL